MVREEHLTLIQVEKKTTEALRQLSLNNRETYNQIIVRLIALQKTQDKVDQFMEKLATNPKAIAVIRKVIKDEKIR